MAFGWRAEKILLNSADVVVGESETDTPISVEFNLSAQGAQSGLRFEVVADDVTDTTGITVKLQHKYGDSAWEDVHASKGQVTIDDDGTFSMALSAHDSSDAELFPLRTHARLVCSTGADDAVTFTDIRVLQET